MSMRVFVLVATVLFIAAASMPPIGMAATVTTVQPNLKTTTKTQGDFNLGNRFSFEIDGVMVAGVHKIEGLEHEHEIVEYQDGDDMTTHFRPGRTRPGRITITKDWSNTSEFYSWYQAVHNGQRITKTCQIDYYTPMNRLRHIVLYACFPLKWTGPALNARNSGHASESIMISYETFEMK